MVSATLRLRVTEPYSFGQSLRFLSGFRMMEGEQLLGPDYLTKAFMVEGRCVAASLRDGGPGFVSLALEAQGPLSVSFTAAVSEKVSAFLGLGESLAALYRLAGDDPGFDACVARQRGLHHLKFPSAFEAACWGVINQRVNFPTAKRMKAALVQRLGGTVRPDRLTLSAFPDAAAVLALSPSDLRGLIGHERKAQAIHALAQAFSTVDERFLLRAPLGEVERWLKDIYGVGDFTSGFVLFRGLGRFLRQPFSPKLLSAAERVYGRTLSRGALEALAERYGEWAGHWALYLWASTFPELPSASEGGRVLHG